VIETLADILSQKPKHEVTVFLQKRVLAPVPAVGIGIGQMLWPVQFYSHPHLRAEQVNFHSSALVEGVSPGTSKPATEGQIKTSQ
jgi:hypothetical protein